MKASRPTRLCRQLNTNIKPADSHYDRRTSGGQVTCLPPSTSSAHTSGSPLMSLRPSMIWRSGTWRRVRWAIRRSAWQRWRISRCCAGDCSRHCGAAPGQRRPAANLACSFVRLILTSGAQPRDASDGNPRKGRERPTPKHPKDTPQPLQMPRFNRRTQNRSG
jgi:hypothetical protein